MLNKVLVEMAVYASKEIAAIAKKDPDIVGLSFGEPEFGPPPNTLLKIAEEDLSIESFLDSVKRYEDPRGSIELRRAISRWYKTLYNMEVCPETQVMVTHGGVEAITLSILCGTGEGDGVLVFDPSYMLYQRAIQTLSRRVKTIRRTAHEFEYVNALGKSTSKEVAGSKMMIINSPENPSGYMLSEDDWDAVGQFAQDNDLWVVHDEVYDRMAFDRQHIPARSTARLHEKGVLINSFSKKFGIPGLRIGWLVASPEFIELAAKAHDYLYLGVNIQYEKIATRLLNEDTSEWMADNVSTIYRRAQSAMRALTEEQGFRWPRKPLGAMFLFPDISLLHAKIPDQYRQATNSVSQAVADYLIKEKKVAVVPGHVYGAHSDNHVRMVLCSTQAEFDLAIERLRTC